MVHLIEELRIYSRTQGCNIATLRTLKRTMFPIFINPIRQSHSCPRDIVHSIELRVDRELTSLLFLDEHEHLRS